MALFRQVSKIIDGNKIVERIQMTAEDEAETIAEWAANEAEFALNIIEQKRKKLIAHEREKAINAIIAPEKTAIEAMSETALDAEISKL